MLDLKIKILDDMSNLYMLYNDWNSKHDGDAGMDLYCPDQLIIEPGETHLIKMGIACEMTDEYLPVSFMLVPRSSISKTPLRMSNSIGIIDSGYRGNLKAAMDYYDFPTKSPTLEQGKRYWQLCSPDLKPFDIVRLVEDLDETTRGSGGHGSTGN